ncbi:MAG: IS110 family transposase [Acidimicrobiales bacterium]
MANPSMAQPSGGVTVGVDTHGEVHVAVALSSDLGQRMAQLEIPTTPAGYRRLLQWARALGDPIPRFGIEGTASYGAGLTRHLQRAGCVVIEVNRPNRQTRRARGKSDPVDAEAAARAVLSGEASVVPKADQERVGMVRVLGVVRRSAVQSRTQVSNQIKALIVTAPAPLRQQLRSVSEGDLIETLAELRPGPLTTPLAATKLALRCLARRHQLLDQESVALDLQLDPLTQQAAPRLRAMLGVGTGVAGALLVAVGDNPGRLRSESSFAHLCGVAPLPASSGKTTGRYRLNRGGNRQANNALWRIVVTRMAWHQPTREYVARRTTEGLSKKEIIRCLKRYVAREVFHALRTVPEVRPTA